MPKLKSIIEAFEGFTQEDNLEPVIPETVDSKPSNNIIQNSYVDGVNNLVTKAWELIGDLHGTIATVELDDQIINKEELKSELESATDQALIVVGLLNKALSTIDPNLMNIINNLYDIKTKGCQAQRLQLGPTNLAKLTDEEKQIAINKGWNLS